MPLPDLAERVGFEPTVAINHTAFRERPIEARAGSLWAAEGHSEYESGADRAAAGWSGTANVAAAGAKMATVGADLGTNFSILGRLRPRSGRQGGWVYPLDRCRPQTARALTLSHRSGPRRRRRCQRLALYRRSAKFSRGRNQVANAGPLIRRVVSPVICATTSSTAGDSSQETPFTSRNVRKATHVVRLFPSTHAWLATRPSASTAAWSTRSDLR